MVPNRDTEAPLLLSARVNVLAGGTAVADTAALSTPFRKPCIIDEVRFTASAAITNGNPLLNGAVVNWGGLIKAKLSLGRIPLTNGFVYIWLFGTSINSELTIDPIIGGSAVATRWSFGHFRWKLPKPLYVPAGQTLTCDFSRDADPDTYAISDTANSSVTVDVAYAGRYLKPTAAVPSVLEVPYVTSYVAPPGVTTAQSSEHDLVNPFLIPLNVQRMIGRNRFLINGSASELCELPGAVPVMVQIKDSWGHNILRDFTAFYDVFQYPRRSWTFHRILEPKERYNVSLREITQFTPPEAQIPMISIVGWREELLR